MATPRVTRSRAGTPLPAIERRSNEAYGARGKATLHAQMRQPSEQVADAFENARQASAAPALSAAAEEDDEEGGSPPKQQQSRQRSSRQRLQPAAAERRAVEPTEAAERTASNLSGRIPTALDNGARYERANREGAAEMYQPSRTRDLPWNIFSFLFLLFGTISFMALWSYIPLPEAMASTRDDLCFGLKRLFRIPPWDVPPSLLEERWYRFKHDEIFSKELPTHNMPGLQWSININFLERIERMEAKVNAVEGDMALHHKTMNMIQEMLPSHVVVKVVDGKFEIPEAFWQALQERLGEESDMAPLWNAYISRNEREIEELNKQLVSFSLDRAMDEYQILTRAQFAREMAEQINGLKNHFREEFRAIQEEHLEGIRDVAKRTASDVLAKSPSGQFAKDHLSELVKAMSVKNFYDSLRAPNWFSFGLGARIDPWQTTATMNVPPRSWYNVFGFRRHDPLVMEPNPPVVALKRWDEATECWCGSLAEADEVHITVRTVKNIYASRLVLEHVPSVATTDIAAAPREVEIWAETPSRELARTFTEEIAADEIHLTSFRRPCTAPPTPNHVCIGQGNYDIHHDNWVQDFRLVHRLVATNKFTIRAAENWGANHTCFYRLRMFGDDATPE